MAWGTMLMAYGGFLYTNDILTDSGEGDYVQNMQRASTGMPSMALRHVKNKDGEYMVQINKLQPWGSILVMGADIKNIIDTNEERTATDMIMKTVWGFKQSLANSSWLPNLHKLLDVVVNDKLEPWEAQQAMNSIIASMLPAPVRSGSSAYESTISEVRPYKFQFEDVEGGKPQDSSLIAARLVAAGTGHESRLYPKRNWKGHIVVRNDNRRAAKEGVRPLGVPRVLTEGMLAFMHVTEAKASMVDKVLADIRLNLPIPQTSIAMPQSGLSIPMTPEEYDAFRLRIGKIKDSGGKTVEQRMRNAILAPNWEALPRKHPDSRVPDKHKILLRIFNQFKGYAKMSVVNEYNIFARGDLASIMEYNPLKGMTKKDGQKPDYQWLQNQSAPAQ